MFIAGSSDSEYSKLSIVDILFPGIDLNFEIRQFLGSHRDKNLSLLLLWKPNI
jgi:hypothetical protein